MLVSVGVYTKISLNVRHRVVSPAGIAERTASLEIRVQTLAREGVTRLPQKRRSRIDEQTAMRVEVLRTRLCLGGGSALCRCRATDAITCLRKNTLFLARS